MFLLQIRPKNLLNRRICVMFHQRNFFFYTQTMPFLCNKYNISVTIYGDFKTSNIFLFSAVVDTGGQAGGAQSRWPGDRPGSMSGCGPRGPGAASAALSAAPAPGLSAPGWSSCVTNSGPELDAAVALSQLAHSAPLPPPPSAASLP